MRKKNIGIKIFKYVIVALIIAFTVTLLIVTGGSNKPFETVAKVLEASLNTETLEKMETQALKRYYGLNGSDYEGVLIYLSKSSMSAEEVLLIKAKSEEQVSAIQEAIESRRDSRRSDFDGYAPEEVKLLDESVLQVRGKYVFYAVSKDVSKYKKAFTEGL